MSWGTLLANQMVSYTDATGGGFTIKPGQTNPGTLQCMTKAQAFDMYYLQTTSNTNAVASNQLMRKDYWLSGTVLPYSYTLYYSGEDGDPNYIGFILSTEACSQTIYTRTVYSDSSTIAYGMPLYYDQYGTTPLSCNAYNSGAYIYYKLNSALITFQDNTGYHSGYIINSAGTCSISTAVTLQWWNSSFSYGASCNLRIFINGTLTVDDNQDGGYGSGSFVAYTGDTILVIAQCGPNYQYLNTYAFEDMGGGTTFFDDYNDTTYAFTSNSFVIPTGETAEIWIINNTDLWPL